MQARRMHDAAHIFLIEEFKMKIRALLASVGAALALGLASPAWALYVISVDAPTTGVQGSTVTVNVNLSIDASDSVDAVGFSLMYDQSVLTYLSGDVGALNPLWIFDDGSSTGGEVIISMLDFDLIQGPKNDSVAQLMFLMGAPGTSGLSLSNILLSTTDQTTLSDAPDFGFVNLQVNSVTDSAITVQAVNKIPAPGTVLLLGLGLALLGWTRRHTAANH
jgi:hypothetical protein